MRAAHAAKDLQGTASYMADFLDEFVEEVAAFIKNENDIGSVDGAWVDSFAKYMKEKVLPVLKVLLRALCAKRPANPLVAAFSILAGELGVPENVLSGLAPFIDGQVKPPAWPSSPNRVAIRKPSLKKRADVKIRQEETTAKESVVEATQSFAEDRRSVLTTESEALSVATDRKSLGATSEPERKSFLKETPRASARSLMLPTRDETRRLSNADRLWNVIRKCLERPAIVGNSPKKGANTQKKTKFLLRRDFESNPAVGKSMTLEEKMSYLRLVPVLSKCSEDELAQVAGIAQTRQFRKGENFVEFGKECDQLHIVTEGAGRVCVPNYAGVIKQGECVGEDSLRIHGALNTFEVCAVGGNVSTLTICRSAFEDLPIKKHMDRRKKAVAIAGGPPRDGTSPNRGSSLSSSHQQQGSFCPDTKHQKVVGYSQTAEDREEIIMAVRNNKVMSEVMGLSEEQCAMIADSVQLVEVAANTPLFHKGDKGTALFILKEGLLTVHLKNKREVTISPGTAIGELALLYDEPRSASIEAVLDSKLWVLPRLAFKSISQMSANKRLKQYAQMLAKIPAITTRLDTSLFEVLAEVLEEVCLVEGEEVCTAGEDEGTLFLISEGTCECLDKDTQKPVGFKEGDWIGEEQLFQGITAERTLVVTSEIATVLVLQDVAFRIVEEATRTKQSDKKGKLTEMGGLHAVTNKTMRQHLHEMQAKRRGMKLARHASRDEFTDPGQSSKAVEMLRRCEVIGGLGEGSFGLVVLMREKITKQEYALKGLSKAKLKEDNQEEMVQNERSVLMLFDSDFIVRLHCTFEDPMFLYLLLDPAMGGELFDVYQENNFFGSAPHALFYIACVSLGLAHMHAKRVIWRDLKLENCLLSSQGYLKLTDMGIAKLVVGKTYSVCGTADYLAPETLRQVGHNRGVDWWACGVLLFIMLAGRSPFDAPEVPQIYKNIIKGMHKVEFPKTCSVEAEELIRALCMKKPEDRLAMQKGGVSNLMAASFFDGFNWDQLTALKMKPPFLPASPNYEQIASKKLSRPMEIQWDDVKELQ